MQLTSKILTICIVVIVVLSINSEARAVKKAPVEVFDIKGEPSPKDWKHFIAADEKVREKLWAYHAKRGKNLGAWSWGWRLGWVKTCTYSRKPHCSAILRQALTDRAMVVRAEVATSIGRRYRGSANHKVVGVLAKAYRDKRNMRNGKPLFVKKRILYSLRQIGGEKALARAFALAGQHPQTRHYWQLLSSVAITIETGGAPRF